MVPLHYPPPGVKMYLELVGIVVILVDVVIVCVDAGITDDKLESQKLAARHSPAKIGTKCTIFGQCKNWYKMYYFWTVQKLVQNVLFLDSAKIGTKCTIFGQSKNWYKLYQIWDTGAIGSDASHPKRYAGIAQSSQV